MRCTNCGNTELFQTQAILVLYGSGSVNADIFACNKCGHVEMFVPQKTIDEHNERVEEAKKQKQERFVIEQEINKVKERMEKLNLIIQDENQTVKAVNAARREFDEYSKKLKSLAEWQPNGKFDRMQRGSKGDG